MRDETVQVHPPSPAALVTVVGTLVAAFWLAVVAQVLVGRPTEGELVVGNAVVVLVTALLVGVGTLRARPQAESLASWRERAKTTVAWVLAVPACYLAIGVVAYALVFEGLLAGRSVGVYYPNAVGRWFVLVPVLWVALVLATVAAGGLAVGLRRSVGW